jgi:hypothetical protein
VSAAPAGSLDVSKRGHRIFRKYAGSVCQSVREELGLAGLLWTKAAWEGSLHVAMAGLKWLADTLEVGLQEGFERVLASIKQAHLEGLQQPARASNKAHSAPASLARPRACSTSKKATERLARLLGKRDKGENLPPVFANQTFIELLQSL